MNKQYIDPQDPATAICALNNGKQIVYGSASGAIRVWNLENDTVLRTIHGHAGWVRAIKVFNDDHHVITASEDGTLKAWNLQIQNQDRSYNSHVNRIFVLFSISGKWILSGSWGLLILHDIKGGKVLKKYPDFSGSRWNISISASRSLILYRTINGEIKLSDLEQKQSDRFLGISRDSPGAVALSDDGLFAAWANEDSVIILNLTDESIICTLENQHAVYWLCFAGKNYCLISCHNGDRLQIYDYVKQVFIDSFEREIASLYRALLFGWGQHSFWRSNSGHVYLDPMKYQQNKESWQHGLANTLCKYSSSDKTYVLSSTAYDSVVFLWQPTDKVARKFLIGHFGKVNSGCIFDHGMKAVTVSEDHSLKIWDLHLEQEIASIILDNELTEVIAVETENTTFITVGDAIGNIYTFEFIST